MPTASVLPELAPSIDPRQRGGRDDRGERPSAPDPPSAERSGERLAYVYTSGSTGRPKGRGDRPRDVVRLGGPRAPARSEPGPTTSRDPEGLLAKPVVHAIAERVKGLLRRVRDGR